MRASALPRMDGVSIVPVLRGAPRLARERIFWHYPHYSPQLGRPAAAVRERDWKLIRFFGGGREELYNLSSDMGETNDRTAAEPAIARRLSSALTAWLNETGAQLPTPNPQYDAAREWQAGQPIGPVPK